VPAAGRFHGGVSAVPRVGGEIRQLRVHPRSERATAKQSGPASSWSAKAGRVLSKPTESLVLGLIRMQTHRTCQTCRSGHESTNLRIPVSLLESTDKSPERGRISREGMKMSSTDYWRRLDAPPSEISLCWSLVVLRMAVPPFSRSGSAHQATHLIDVPNQAMDSGLPQLGYQHVGLLDDLRPHIGPAGPRDPSEERSQSANVGT
jgi:hypothetical protein